MQINDSSNYCFRDFFVDDEFFFPENITQDSNNEPTYDDISENPFKIREVSEKTLRNNRLMAVGAVCENGLTIHFLPEEMRKDKQIREISTKRIPKQLKSDFIGNRIFFNDSKIASITKKPYFNTIHQVGQSVSESSCFIRDSQVTLFSGNHLIPYSLKMPMLDDYIFALLPHYASFFFIDGKSVATKKCVSGIGYYKHNTAQSMITAYDKNLSFKQGKTCIEGGNCFLFKLNGKKMAILGEISFYLSILALEKQLEFSSLKPSKKAPSNESIRIARNLAIVKKFEENINNHPIGYKRQNNLKFRQLINEPVTTEDRIKHYESAKLIEAKLKITKSIIAKELEISVDNLAILPQTKFHIDMELFVTPEGEVVLHDNNLAMDFINEIASNYELTSEESDLLDEYGIHILKHERYSREIQKLRGEILKKHGIPHRAMPLSFRSKIHNSSLNFANGIFVENEKYKGYKHFSYISTGPSYKEEEIFYNKFIQIFEQNFPDTNYVGIPKISKFISKHGGGVHCMTMEENLICDQ